MGSTEEKGKAILLADNAKTEKELTEMFGRVSKVLRNVSVLTDKFCQIDENDDSQLSKIPGLVEEFVVKTVNVYPDGVGQFDNDLSNMQFIVASISKDGEKNETN